METIKTPVDTPDPKAYNLGDGVFLIDGDMIHELADGVYRIGVFTK